MGWTFLGSGRVVVHSWPGNGSPVPEKISFFLVLVVRMLLMFMIFFASRKTKNWSLHRTCSFLRVSFLEGCHTDCWTLAKTLCLHVVLQQDHIKEILWSKLLQGSLYLGHNHCGLERGKLGVDNCWKKILLRLKNCISEKLKWKKGFIFDRSVLKAFEVTSFSSGRKTKTKTGSLLQF